MKKLVFTALAMVAFSGIAMANSTEVKEGKKEKFKKEVVLKADSCQKFAMDFIDEYDSNNPGHEMDSTTANNVYQELLRTCYEDMG